MKEFALIFRVNESMSYTPTPAQMQERMTSWMDWMGGIAARDRLVNSGSRLGVKESGWIGPKGVSTDGPYTEIKEFINGFILIKADSLEDALGMAKGCPIVPAGGIVEVRPLVAPDFNE
jgi:hypothetical protein